MLEAGEQEPLSHAGSKRQQQLPIFDRWATIQGYNLNCMRRAVIIGLAALLLIVVAAVLVSPIVDLDPAAFRSPSWAFALLMCLAFFKKLPALVRSEHLSVSARPTNFWPVPAPPKHAFELNCARLC
jgi:hypothetical protein